jgi:hypothetical protein
MLNVINWQNPVCRFSNSTGACKNDMHGQKPKSGKLRIKYDYVL